MATVISRAEALWQAKKYSGSGALLDERNSHDAQLGSTSGADTNDPLFLAHAGEQYAYYSGISGNYCSTPDAAPLDFSADVDIRVRLTASDWSTAPGQALLGKFVSGQNAYMFALDDGATKKLRWLWGESGFDVKETVSSVALPGDFVDGIDQSPMWVKVTFDADNGASQFEAKFWWSADLTNDPTAVSWTQLGTTQTGTNTFINNSTENVGIGANGSAGTSILEGKMFRLQARDGIDGTIQLDVDFTDTAAVTEPFATFTEGSSNAATITINRSATGRKMAVVDRSLFLLGVDDYLEVPDDANLDFAAGDDVTVILVGRSYDVTPGSDQALLAKKTNFTTAAGYALKIDTLGTSDGVIADGTNSSEDVSAALTDGQLFTVAIVRNTTDDDVEAFLDGIGSGSPTVDATTATLANAGVLRIGSVAGAAGSFLDGEFVAAALWREALSDADVATAGDELITAFSSSRRRRLQYMRRILIHRR